MKVYLVRHGIASERIGGAILNDAQRPLTDEGRAELRLVAQALKKIGVKADLVVSSPLIRAKQTAEILNDFLGNGDVQITDALAPAGDPNALWKFLKKFPHSEEVFFVGHEPDIGRLACNLMWAGPEVEMPFKKATVCRVDVSSFPPSYPGILKWLMTPKIASAIADK